MSNIMTLTDLAPSSAAPLSDTESGPLQSFGSRQISPSKSAFSGPGRTLGSSPATTSQATPSIAQSAPPSDWSEYIGDTLVSAGEATGSTLWWAGEKGASIGLTCLKKGWWTGNKVVEGTCATARYMHRLATESKYDRLSRNAAESAGTLAAKDLTRDWTHKPWADDLAEMKDEYRSEAEKSLNFKPTVHKGMKGWVQKENARRVNAAVGAFERTLDEKACQLPEEHSTLGLSSMGI